MTNGSTTNSTTAPTGGARLHNLLVTCPSGELGVRGKLIYDSTKLAFENKLADLYKKKAAAKLAIMELEDFSQELGGARYSAKAWVTKRLKLEEKVAQGEYDIAQAEALYIIYFGEAVPTTTKAPTSSSSTTTPASSSSSTTNPASSTSSTTMAPNTIAFNAALSGATEVPPVSSNGTGEAHATFNNLTKVLVLAATYNGITATAAHIHKGAVGADGPVVLPLVAANGTINYTSSPLTAAQEADLKAGLYYVNIHTTANPDGELRGQLVM